MDFSTFLTRQLERNQMSYSDLARQLELNGFVFSKAAIGHWKSGKNNPPMEDLAFRLALARSLRIDVNQMMRILGYTSTEDDRSAEARLAADLIDAMPPTMRPTAVGILEQLLGVSGGSRRAAGRRHTARPWPRMRAR